LPINNTSEEKRTFVELKTTELTEDASTIMKMLR